MYKIILASQSPRRLQILQDARFEVSVSPVKVSETIDKNLTPSEAIRAISESKIKAFVEAHPSLKGQNILGLSADTMVVQDLCLLGKPKSADHAAQMLEALSGKTHQVISAFSIFNFRDLKLISKVSTTSVEFLKLSQSQISSYIKSGEPFDKAGAYGIQGEAKKFVKMYVGALSTVIGFPIEDFIKTLKNEGLDVQRKS